jgi:hypothetical protein
MDNAIRQGPNPKEACYRYSALFLAKHRKDITRSFLQNIARDAASGNRHYRLATGSRQGAIDSAV